MIFYNLTFGHFIERTPLLSKNDGHHSESFISGSSPFPGGMIVRVVSGVSLVFKDIFRFYKLLGAFNLLLFLSGCLSIGSGPLSDSISVQSGQTKIKYKLPNGFCLDRSANTFSSLQQTLLVTNCIAVNTVDQPYYSRRPVDTIVNITFTQSRVPKKISQRK